MSYPFFDEVCKIDSLRGQCEGERERGDQIGDATSNESAVARAPIPRRLSGPALLKPEDT